MSEYIQIGTAAMRDQAGDFLPAVPLFIRAEDEEKCEARIVINGDAFQKTMAAKYAAYLKEERKAKKTR